MRNVDDLSISAGSGSNYQLELTVPDSLPEDDYIAEIQIKISNLTNVCALQEMGPWVKESDGSYVKTFKVLVTKGNPRSITVPDTATYTLENGNLRVQGRTEPEGRVVLYIDGTAAKEILADGFGKFNTVYALNSSNEEYEITASMRGIYDDGSHGSDDYFIENITVPAAINPVTDAIPTEINIITPANGVILGNDFAGIVFEAEDVVSADVHIRLQLLDEQGDMISEKDLSDASQ